MQGRWTRIDVALCGLLALAAFVTRAVLRARDLTTLDSGLLTMGVVDYDFGVRPHPPYYPLTILLGKGAALFVGPIQSLSWLSVAATPVMVVATYAVARFFVDRWWSSFAAALLVASPVALVNGTAPLSYALEGASSAVLAWAALVTRERPGPRTWIILGALASIAVGLRPSSLILLAPLVLWATTWRLRPIVWTGLAAVVTGLLWGLPALAAGGPVDTMLWGLRYQSRAYVMTNPFWVGGWDTYTLNAYVLSLQLYFERGYLVLVGLAAVLAAWATAPWLRERKVMMFLVAWIVPGLAFYLFVYAGWPVYPSGYLMASVPAAAVVVAVLLAATLATVRQAHVPPMARALGTVAVVALVAMPVTWFSGWDDAIEFQDQSVAWSKSWDGLEAMFPANETALLAFYALPWAALEHPTYETWQLELVSIKPGIPGGWRRQVEIAHGVYSDKGFLDDIRDGVDPEHTMPAHIKRVVLMDGHPLEFNQSLVDIKVHLLNATLPNGHVVRYFETSGFSTIEETLPYFPDPEGKEIPKAVDA